MDNYSSQGRFREIVKRFEILNVEKYRSKINIVKLIG